MYIDVELDGLNRLKLLEGERAWVRSSYSIRLEPSNELRQQSCSTPQCRKRFCVDKGLETVTRSSYLEHQFLCINLMDGR
jgi:hypothetical protein